METLTEMKKEEKGPPHTHTQTKTQTLNFKVNKGVRMSLQALL